MGCGGVSGYGEELHSNNATAQNMEVPYLSPIGVFGHALGPAPLRASCWPSVQIKKNMVIDEHAPVT